MENQFINTLRNGESIMLFDSTTKLRHKIQLNRREKRIYWERYVSLDKTNWTKWNEYLSLKDVVSIRAEIWRNNFNNN